MGAHAEGGASLANILAVLADRFPENQLIGFCYRWENITYSLGIVLLIFILVFFTFRKKALVPGRLQNASELLVSGLDDFVCGIIGPKGRQFTPFVGTLFIYILLMNISGLVPFLKSSTASLSTTLGLALCVFFYVQYNALRQLGFSGYLDHLAGKPRGIIAASVIFPVFMFFLHLITELIRPLSLSLRLRGNIWGDEMLIAVLAKFGIIGLPLLLFNMAMSLLAAVIQAVVFCLLTTIYLSLDLEHEEAA